MDDLALLEPVMDAAISDLQQGFLTPGEVESSRVIMGSALEVTRGAAELGPT
jgi:hypothetical protein